LYDKSTSTLYVRRVSYISAPLLQCLRRWAIVLRFSYCLA